MVYLWKVKLLLYPVTCWYLVAKKWKRMFCQNLKMASLLLMLIDMPNFDICVNWIDWFNTTTIYYNLIFAFTSAFSEVFLCGCDPIYFNNTTQWILELCLQEPISYLEPYPASLLWLRVITFRYNVYSGAQVIEAYLHRILICFPDRMHDLRQGQKK